MYQTREKLEQYEEATLNYGKIYHKIDRLRAAVGKILQDQKVHTENRVAEDNEKSLNRHNVVLQNQGVLAHKIGQLEQGQHHIQNVINHVESS